jgi:hypothetical protein
VRQNAEQILAIAGFKRLISAIKYQELLPDPFDETPSASYLQRTEWNARDSDATVIFTLAPTLTGGSKRTAEFAEKHRKHWIHLARRSSNYESPALMLQRFVEENGVQVLNVAGTRGSKEPDVWQFAYETLEAAFFWEQAHPGRLGGPGEG